MVEVIYVGRYFGEGESERERRERSRERKMSYVSGFASETFVYKSVNLDLGYYN